MMAAPDTLLTAALAAYDAGLCVVRATIDGTKSPVGRWKQYQSERPTRDEVAAWFADGYPGVGVICGAVSGNLEMLELEGRFIDELGGPAFTEAAQAAGLELTLRRIATGLQIMSPSGGRHFIYRVDGPVDGNTKLARRPSNDTELAANPDDLVKTLIETRGEGGFVVLAPSHGPVHPTGRPWKIRNGTFADIPTITAEERQALFALARTFDTAPLPPKPKPVPPSQRTRITPHAGSVGGSWFDAVTEHVGQVRPVLEHHGWEYCYTDAHGRQLLRRPGKTQGVSGSINENGRFLPFSTSVPFEVGGIPPTTYDTLDVIAAYEHGGDRQTAARTIAEATGILAAWQREQNDVTKLVAPPSNVDPDTGEIITPRDPRNLPDEFWTARPELDHIRQAAHSRVRSADAVFAAVLARISVLTPPTVTLPPIAGDAGSLNLLCGIVASSGGGKTTSARVAAALVPIEQRTDIVTNGLGSGEGLIDQYFELVEEEIDGKKRKVKSQTRVAALVLLDEGQALAEMGSRSGSTLLPTLRSAWSGARLGQANASIETFRQLADHSYRMACIAGFQPEYAHGLIADAVGGTPQRFLFAHGADSTIPTEHIEWPGELDFEPPPRIMGGTEVEFDRGIASEIRTRALARQRGETREDPLDSHADLQRMKIAALLSILDGRLHVSVEDWDLAGVVMAASNAVRGWVIEVARQAEQHSEAARSARMARQQAHIDDSAEERALVAGARAMARRAHRAAGETLAKRDPMSAVAGRHRKLASTDEMIAYATDHGWLTPIPDGWKAGESRPT